MIRLLIEAFGTMALALLGILLMFSCADKAMAADYPKSIVYDGMPPPRLRAPNGDVIRVVFGLIKRCGHSGIAGAYFEACTRDGGVVYLPNPCDYGDREEFARLTCHELAHTRGWPATHGD